MLYCPNFFGMCCRSEWQERMYIYKWHEVDQTKHEIFCVHIVCNEIQVKVNLEITTLFFICVFHTVPTFSDLGLYNHVYLPCMVPHWKPIWEGLLKSRKSIKNEFYFCNMNYLWGKNVFQGFSIGINCPMKTGHFIPWYMSMITPFFFSNLSLFAIIIAVIIIN